VAPWPQHRLPAIMKELPERFVQLSKKL
jgi:hypothetical protein